VKYKFLISFLFVFLATSVSMAQSTIGAGGLGSEVNASSKTGTGGISINDSVVSPRSVDNHADLHLNWNDVNPIPTQVINYRSYQTFHQHPFVWKWIL